jgi:glutamine cyclotransferase
MRSNITLKRLLAAAGILAFGWAGACSETASPPPSGTLPDTSITEYSYRIVNTFPHDEEAFTQGLVFVDSVFIEGTGNSRYDVRSTLRRVEVESGSVIDWRYMPGSWFGEGVAVWGDSVVQLTWTSGIAVVYRRDSFDEIGRFDYPTEGWGLTHDGTRFIMSDGTDTLYFRDRDTFDEIGRVNVYDDNGPVDYLNELEYINGYVYANRWQTDWILVIDPGTGRVRARIDLTGMEIPRRGVPNGIAYDATSGRLFVTGKLWRHLYEIELVERTGQ